MVRVDLERCVSAAVRDPRSEVPGARTDRRVVGRIPGIGVAALKAVGGQVLVAETRVVIVRAQRPVLLHEVNNRAVADVADVVVDRRRRRQARDRVRDVGARVQPPRLHERRGVVADNGQAPAELLESVGRDRVGRDVQVNRVHA